MQPIKTSIRMSLTFFKFIYVFKPNALITQVDTLSPVNSIDFQPQPKCRALFV